MHGKSERERERRGGGGNLCVIVYTDVAPFPQLTSAVCTNRRVATGTIKTKNKNTRFSLTFPLPLFLNLSFFPRTASHEPLLPPWVAQYNTLGVVHGGVVHDEVRVVGVHQLGVK